MIPFRLEIKGDKRIRNFLSRHFSVILRSMIRFNFNFNLCFKQEVYVVFTNGKTASSSVLKSLRNAGFFAVQVHELLQNRIDIKKEEALCSKKKAIPYHLYISEFVNEAVLKTNKVRFITIFRNDMAQNLSALFQNLDMYPLLDIDDLKKVQERMNFISFDNEKWFESQKEIFRIYNKQLDTLTLHFENKSVFSCPKNFDISSSSLKCDLVYPDINGEELVPKPYLSSDFFALFIILLSSDNER